MPQGLESPERAAAMRAEQEASVETEEIGFEDEAAAEATTVEETPEEALERQKEEIRSETNKELARAEDVHRQTLDVIGKAVANRLQKQFPNVNPRVYQGLGVNQNLVLASHFRENRAAGEVPVDPEYTRMGGDVIQAQIDTQKATAEAQFAERKAEILAREAEQIKALESEGETQES